MTVDEAMKYARGQLESAFEKWLSDECPSGDVEQVQRQWDESFAHEELVNELQPVMALTWEVSSLRSEIDSAREDLKSFVDARNEWKQRAEAAEAVLQNLMSYLSVNGCRTEIDPENAELRILDGINMLVRPAVERAERAEAALKEARDVITELADDLSIELDMRYQSRSHYPSELRKYENEMQPVYRARALLQSVGEKK